MLKQNYMNRSNLEYVEGLYKDFLKGPENVPEEWRQFFEGVEFAKELQTSDVEGDGAFSMTELRVNQLVKAYRDYGHMKAKLDPLGLAEPVEKGLRLEDFDLSADDLEKDFAVSKTLGLPEHKLVNIITHLEDSYCGHLTGEFSDCRQEVRDWFRKELESKEPPLRFTAEDRKQIFQQLARTESLEKFIHTRYVGTKRFSIEGGDAMIPMLESLVQRGTADRLEEVVIGMAHRGRINVLANFMGKGLENIFSEFDGTAFETLGSDGDVKYHLGYSVDKETPNGKCHISLAFNPSHLEAVNPVVLGMARAKQRQHNDTSERKKVLPVLIHGDAAFIGQGVVSETLQLSQLPGYTVGGSIHIVVNNQVGFTTNPEDGRSTRYSSDVAKTIKAPVLLVNGDDAEACVRAMDIAFRFRQEFGEDVVIDLICYRRFGHNEGDEPAFTQPKMYQVIKKHPTLLKIYQTELIEKGIITEQEAKSFYQEKIDNLQKILDSVREKPPEVKPDAFGGMWAGLRSGKLEDFEKIANTKCDKATLEQAAKVLTTAPENFNAHKKLLKLIDQRNKMYSEGFVDWGLGELLAYGTLCAEGTPVRLSGQDVNRGTFTHRHAGYFDTETGARHVPLEAISPDKGEFNIYNSPLSEFAVLGVEFGNASSDPTFLTLWEAQFGDFANGAQIIIDQFLASSEEKWSRGCGLTLLLPHGYEGQGPEHSSARLERFLQLCAQANMQVCNLTTPANLFHALRRQVKRDFRKPLVIMSPKSLLRHPKVVSSVSELHDGQFYEVLEDSRVQDTKAIEKLVLCSGKLFYDLDKAREDNLDYQKASETTAIVRIEQLYPFPYTQLAPFLSGFPKLKTVVWAQEEPKNMGAWLYIRPKLRKILQDVGLEKIDLDYAGRSYRASPATGSPKQHEREQLDIIKQCFTPS